AAARVGNAGTAAHPLSARTRTRAALADLPRHAGAIPGAAAIRAGDALSAAGPLARRTNARTGITRLARHCAVDTAATAGVADARSGYERKSSEELSHGRAR